MLSIVKPGKRNPSGGFPNGMCGESLTGDTERLDPIDRIEGGPEARIGDSEMVLIIEIFE